MQPADDSIRRYPPAFQGWWAVTVFAIAAVLSYTDRQILGLLVDPIRGDLHISDTEISILQGAAFAVLYSFVGLPLGRIADLVPRRALLVFAVVMWSFGTIVCGYANSFAALFGARLLVGIGEAALAPAAMSLIADFFPPTARATPTGVFLTGMVIGGGAAVGIGGALLSAAEHAMFAHVPAVGVLAPWREVLVVLGIVGLAVALLMLTLRDPNARSVTWQEARSRMLAFGDVAHAVRSQYATLLPLYAAMAIGSIIDYAIISWSPALLSRNFGYSAAEIGAGLGLVSIIAGLLGTPGGGWLADWVANRYGSSARIRLCEFTMIVGFAAAPIGFVGNATAVLVCAFVWILVSSFVGTIGIATTLDLLPDESRGLGTSIIAFCNTIVGLGTGPTLVALASDYIYKSPNSIGLAMSTVFAPCVLASCILFYMASRSVRGARVAPA
jgi:MFS family permease